jgi:2-polyprenyl-3-methyl-5-hydroxy-6-metoxy-1,4-benzoquinol methylase
MAKCTDKEFLQTELQMGISLDNPQFLDLGRNTIAQVNGYGNIILDFGCGVGAYSKAALDAGLDVYAYEKFKAHRDYLKENLPALRVVTKLEQLKTKYNLNRLDILMFIETAEHMTDDEIRAMFQHINPIWILFSSTSQKTDNDEAWGHINVKEQSEWDSFFLDLGYRIHKHLSLPTAWSKIYQLI